MKEKKSAWKSVTIWSGLISVVIGMGMMSQGQVEAGAAAIATGIVTIWGRVRAKEKIG
jgi:hypothetical protein